MDKIIFESGITLTETERAYLSQSSWSLNKQIRRIMKKYPKGFTYQEMKNILEHVHGKTMNIDSVRRGITQQTKVKSRLTELEDRYGRMPLVKTDEKRPNEKGTINISVYAYNERYGQPPSHTEVVREHQEKGQMSFL